MVHIIWSIVMLVTFSRCWGQTVMLNVWCSPTFTVSNIHQKHLYYILDYIALDYIAIKYYSYLLGSYSFDIVNRRIRWLNYSILWINLFQDEWTVHHGPLLDCSEWVHRPLIPIPTKKPGRNRGRPGRRICCGCCCCSSCCGSFCIDSSCRWLFRCFAFETFLISGVFVELSTKIFMIITTVLVTRFQIKVKGHVRTCQARVFDKYKPKSNTILGFILIQDPCLK